MIDIEMNNNYCQIEGHAEYDIKGKDIVCSAVSALSQSVLMALKEIKDVEVLQIDNFFLFQITENNEITDTMFSVLKIGLLEISEQYPNHVKVKIQGDGIKWHKKKEVLK